MGRDAWRAGAILAAGLLIGGVLNALSAHPVALMDPRGPGAWPERAPRILVEEVRERQARGEAVLLLDVRAESSFKAGHPAGAINLPETSFVRDYGVRGLATTLKAASLTVVLCDSERCPSADRVATRLRSLGHGDVRVLSGGWQRWKGR